MARLYPHERAVMQLVYWETKTLDEVAAMLDISPKVAQRRHAAALRKLHQLLEGRTKKRT